MELSNKVHIHTEKHMCLFYLYQYYKYVEVKYKNPLIKIEQDLVDKLIESNSFEDLVMLKNFLLLKLNTNGE